METWLAPVTLVTHHARFAAALAVVVTLGAEGACRESRDRDLSTHTHHRQLAVFFNITKEARKMGKESRKHSLRPTSDSLPKGCC